MRHVIRFTERMALLMGRTSNEAFGDLLIVDNLCGP